MTLRSLALSLTLLGITGAFAQTAPIDPAASQPDLQQCNTEADRNKMNEGERETFLRECLAGKKLDNSSSDKSAPPAR